jgi:hypothetical protein
MKKVTNHPDISQLSAEGVHAPDLSIHKGMKLGISDKRSKAVTKHLEAAKKHLTPEVSEFSSRMASGEGVHKRMHELVRNYSNAAARTTGKRSVAGLRKHVAGYAERTVKSEAGRKKLHDALHADIDANKHHLNALFKAHHHIVQAKHHMLDEFGKSHRGKFDIDTHGGEEHEGLVSSMKTPHGETMVKLVREGEGGFPARNTANAAIRFGKKPVSESPLSLDISATTMMETHYMVHGRDDITLEEVVAMLPSSELEQLAEGKKDKIVVRAGRKTVVLR